MDKSLVVIGVVFLVGMSKWNIAMLGFGLIATQVGIAHGFTKFTERQDDLFIRVREHDEKYKALAIQFDQLYTIVRVTRQELGALNSGPKYT